ncbi:hypothetical protein J6590_048700 [Homalodisca vitripennis]|nr:hypothetical protein J6590_048700 [Homalodisca vitripennis]
MYGKTEYTPGCLGTAVVSSCLVHNGDTLCSNPLLTPKHTLNFNYLLQDIGLRRVEKFKDLGVLLSSNFDTGFHVSKTCRKALQNLGLIYRTCRRGLSASSLKTLYAIFPRDWGGKGVG